MMNKRCNIYLPGQRSARTKGRKIPAETRQKDSPLNSRKAQPQIMAAKRFERRLLGIGGGVHPLPVCGLIGTGKEYRARRRYYRLISGLGALEPTDNCKASENASGPGWIASLMYMQVGKPAAAANWFPGKRLWQLYQRPLLARVQGAGAVAAANLPHRKRGDRGF